EICGLGGRAGQAPGAVVAPVPGASRRRLDLRALPPLVEARDRHGVRRGGEGGGPERVVGDPVPPRASGGSLARAPTVVAGADARQTGEMLRTRLRADPRELPAAVG